MTSGRCKVHKTEQSRIIAPMDALRPMATPMLFDVLAGGSRLVNIFLNDLLHVSCDRGEMIINFIRERRLRLRWSVTTSRVVSTGGSYTVQCCRDDNDAERRGWSGKCHLRVTSCCRRWPTVSRYYSPALRKQIRQRLELNLHAPPMPSTKSGEGLLTLLSAQFKDRRAVKLPTSSWQNLRVVAMTVTSVYDV